MAEFHCVQPLATTHVEMRYDSLRQTVISVQSTRKLFGVAGQLSRLRGTRTSPALWVVRGEKEAIAYKIMTGRGTVNIAVKQLGGCIVLAYSVIAWGILCSRREGSGVAVQATAMRRHL